MDKLDLSIFVKFEIFDFSLSKVQNFDVLVVFETFQLSSIRCVDTQLSLELLQLRRKVLNSVDSSSQFVLIFFLKIRVFHLIPILILNQKLHVLLFKAQLEVLAENVTDLSEMLLVLRGLDSLHALFYESEHFVDFFIFDGVEIWNELGHEEVAQVFIIFGAVLVDEINKMVISVDGNLKLEVLQRVITVQIIVIRGQSFCWWVATFESPKRSAARRSLEAFFRAFDRWLLLGLLLLLGRSLLLHHFLKHQFLLIQL